MQHITHEQIKQSLDKNEKILLVDAREESKYNEGHLPGALNIPSEKIKELAPKLLGDKSRKIITYCTNTPCSASTKAAEELIALGYTNVLEYVEGIEGWKAASLKLETGACCGSMSKDACSTEGVKKTA